MLYGKKFSITIKMSMLLECRNVEVRYKHKKRPQKYKYKFITSKILVCNTILFS